MRSPGGGSLYITNQHFISKRVKNMILVECPYCDEKINILFREEIKNLINKGFLDCECDYCRQVFEIY